MNFGIIYNRVELDNEISYFCCLYTKLNIWR